MNLEQEVLTEYNLNVQEIKLLRHNENMTYKVIAKEGEYVLRIHQTVEGMSLSMLMGEAKPEELIAGEMQLLDGLCQNTDLGIQKPVRNRAGQLVTKKNGICATLLKWAPGECVNKQAMEAKQAKQIGAMVAEIHNPVTVDGSISRYYYGVDMVERMRKVCDTILQKAGSENKIFVNMQKVLDKIRAMLAAHEGEFVMIHNDLGGSNLLCSDYGIIPIDFSLSGVCIREMDLASLFLHFEEKEIKDAILQGYNSKADCLANVEHIDICLGYQLLIFILSQYEMICSQGWFTDAMHYWDEEVFQRSVRGERIEQKIGLYS